MKMERKLWGIVLLTVLLTSFVSADVLSVGGTGGGEVLLGYGNQIESFFSGTEVIADRIPEDIDGYLLTAARKITPSREKLGKWIICLLLLILVFIEDIAKLIKKMKIKKSW